MEDIQDKKNWHLIRNNNGEWISEEYAVFLNERAAVMYEVEAVKYGVKLSRHVVNDGIVWYYKHEIEEIDAIMAEKIRQTMSGRLDRKKIIIKRKINEVYSCIMEEKEPEAYYDRRMVGPIVLFLKKELKWMINYVYEHAELDFQTGKNAADSWFSIYRGTGRLFTIKSNGNIFADPKYIDLVPSFYERPTLEGFDTLLKKIAETKFFDRYYIGIDGKKKEGYYQNLISRRYTLFCQPDDDFIIVDKEFVLGYRNGNTKKKWLSKSGEWLKSKIELAKSNGIPGDIKKTGTECDFVGITKDGDLLLMELKRHEDTSKIYLSPLQIGHYDELTRNFIRKYHKDMSSSIIGMLQQKIELGLIKPAWRTIPDKISGKIKLAVIVGGDASKIAKERFSTMRKVVDKKISYYTCDEATGTLIQETW